MCNAFAVPSAQDCFLIHQKPVDCGTNELSRRSTWVCRDILPLFPLFLTDRRGMIVTATVKSRMCELTAGAMQVWDAHQPFYNLELPSGQAEAADFTRCTSKLAFFAIKIHTGSVRCGRNEFFMTINHFQLCTLYIPRHASGADKSPAGWLMKSSSPAAAGGCTKHM